MLLPLRTDTVRLRFPAVTLALVAASLALYSYEATLSPPQLVHLARAAGAIPWEIAHGVDLVDAGQPRDLVPPPFTVVTSWFIHGDPLHLAGNLWFLWLFGAAPAPRASRGTRISAASRPALPPPRGSRPSRGARCAAWSTMRAMRKRKLVVAALVQDRSGRTLLSRRRDDQPMGGLWELPGGKLEEGESPAEALARELAEELGVGSSVGAVHDVVFHRYPEFDLLMLVYRCALDGPPRPLAVAEVAWVEKAHLRDYPVLPADVPLLEALARS